MALTAVATAGGVASRSSSQKILVNVASYCVAQDDDPAASECAIEFSDTMPAAMTNQNPDHDPQPDQATPDQPTVEQDPPYLVELIDAVTAAYPLLTREKAREMLLAAGA